MVLELIPISGEIPGDIMNSVKQSLPCFYLKNLHIKILIYIYVYIYIYITYYR